MTAPRWQIHLLFVTQLVAMGAMEMSGPFWPVHLRMLVHSDDLFSFASVAVYVGPMVGIMLTSTFWGRMGDRFGHKSMMLRALLGLAATQMALAFAGDVWSILILRFLQGACAGYIAPAQAYGVSIENPANRTKLFAYLQISTNVGSLGGAVVGGVILDHASFFWINFTAGLLCFACLLPVVIFLPSVKHRLPDTRMSDAGNARNPQARPADAFRIAVVLLILGVLLLARMVTQSGFSLFVLGRFEVENWVVGACYGLLALGFVTTASFWARYFEARSPRDILKRMCLVIGGCVIVTLIAGATGSIFVFAGMYFVWGGLLGATTPVLTALISRVAPDQQQGRVLGLAQSTAQMSAICGIALGGWFAQVAGLSNIYFLVGLVYLVGLFACAFGYVRMRPRTRPVQHSGD